jgi:hypothetical protein
MKQPRAHAARQDEEAVPSPTPAEIRRWLAVTAQCHRADSSDAANVKGADAASGNATADVGDAVAYVESSANANAKASAETSCVRVPLPFEARWVVVDKLHRILERTGSFHSTSPQDGCRASFADTLFKQTEPSEQMPRSEATDGIHGKDVGIVTALGVLSRFEPTQLSDKPYETEMHVDKPKANSNSEESDFGFGFGDENEPSL